MKIIEKSIQEQWEVSMIELIDEEGKKWKVTRRFPKMAVAETKIFKDKKKARAQHDA